MGIASWGTLKTERFHKPLSIHIYIQLETVLLLASKRCPSRFRSVLNIRKGHSWLTLCVAFFAWMFERKAENEIILHKIVSVSRNWNYQAVVVNITTKHQMEFELVHPTKKNYIFFLICCLHFRPCMRGIHFCHWFALLNFIWTIRS